MLHARSDRGPSGSLEVCYEHSESGSETRDRYETTTLSGYGKQLILTISTRDKTAYDDDDGTTTTKTYTIPPDVLVELIKKHG